MRELSVAEQRYQAVLAVISDGETVTDVAAMVEPGASPSMASVLAFCYTVSAKLDLVET